MPVRPGSIAALAAAALLAPALAACGGGSGGGAAANAAPAASGGASSGGYSAPAAPAAPAGSTSLTPPGAHLGFGQKATVAWIPPSDFGTGAQKGLKLRVSVESIQRGTLADFKNVQLDAGERHDTPYYVTVRITALAKTAPPKTDDPAISFDAIDDRGQKQESVTFLGTFQRCNETTPPKPFTDGKSFTSCLTYLMPGGGSIQKMQWNDGPHGADDVSAYFDHPIVWGAS
jgi:hypothetical protein